MLQTVVDALMELRSPFALYEADIHGWVASRLEAAGLAYLHEARLAPGCRIDFLVGPVGVEIKKGKPDLPALKNQLARYAACAQIEALVVVTQRQARLPLRIGGKPVRQITLSQLWGVALP